MHKNGYPTYPKSQGKSSPQRLKRPQPPNLSTENLCPKTSQNLASGAEADIDNMGFLVPFSTVGNGLWEMDKWEMGGWMASVDSGLWGRKFLGNKGFGRE